MSRNAKIFAEEYRGHPMEVENVLGTEHLRPGQVEAIWTDYDHTAIELSYVHQLGHSFLVVMIDPDTLEVIMALEAGVFGLIERAVPAGFNLTEEMHTAIVRLKTKDAATA